MRHLLLALSFSLILLPMAARSAPEAAESGDSGATECRDAALAAERRHNIPAGLLAAIAMVESGRYMGTGAARSSWPWTIHAEGRGRFHDEKDEAVAEVRALKVKGVGNIDVGCMQVNLHYHPEAFDDLPSAFDPDTNADYAATFLKELFAETRSWSRAVAFYHSRDPERSLAYKSRVMDAWNGERAHAMEDLRERNAARRLAVVERRAAATLRRAPAESSFMSRLRSRPSVYIRTGSSGTRVRTY